VDVKTMVEHDEGAYLSPEEIKKLFDACENETERLFLMTLFFTGARVSEIVGKEVKDKITGETKVEDPLVPKRIIWDKGYIVLRNLKRKRGRRIWKNVYVPKRLLDMLKNYIEKHGIGENEPIFKMSRHNAYYLIRKVGKKAGIETVGRKWLHPHNLRHSYRKIMQDLGFPWKFVMKQMGLVSTDTLVAYETLKEIDYEKNVEKARQYFDNIFFGGDSVGGDEETSVGGNSDKERDIRKLEDVFFVDLPRTEPARSHGDEK